MKIFHLSVSVAERLEKEFYLVQHTEDFTESSHLKHQNVLYEESINEVGLFKPNKIINVELDAYMCEMLENALKYSLSFRRLFSKNMMQVGSKTGLVKVNINVCIPKRQIIDKRGNKLFEISCLERRELDHAMAWFSTLGGAFSALGDKIEYCAIMAGKISQQQFLLALRLGDPNLVARCKLYMALSLIQQKQFTDAKTIIKSQYAVAKKEYERDRRLMSMCLGIWTKWKYDKKQAKFKDKIT
ncbi:uncharacterized protein [Rhodnius prolixus]